MELKAQYDMDDLLDLVEQDLEAKGFRLVGGLTPSISCQDAAVVFTLAIEQVQPMLASLRPEQPAQAVTPKPTPQTKAGKVKTPEQKEKDRAYKREWQEKKRKLQKAGEDALRQAQSAGEVVAPSTVPFHYQQPVPALNGHNHGNGNQNKSL